MPGLDLEFKTAGVLPSAVVVVIKGTLDSTSVIVAQQKFKIYHQKGIKHIILDMNGVSDVNDTGFGFLVNLADTLYTNGGYLVLTGVQAKVRAAMDTLQISSFFRISASIDEAVDMIKYDKKDISKTAQYRTQSQGTQSQLQRGLNSVSNVTFQLDCPLCESPVQVIGFPIEVECSGCKVRVRAMNRMDVVTEFGRADVSFGAIINEQTIEGFKAFLARLGVKEGACDGMFRLLTYLAHLGRNDMRASVEICRLNDKPVAIVRCDGVVASEKSLQVTTGLGNKVKLINRKSGGVCIIV